MTTDERLAALAQRRTRSATPAEAAPGATGATPTTAEARQPAATPPRRTRRKAAAPLTRIVTTGLSLSAVLAGAGFLALADRAASGPTPSQDVLTAPTAPAPAPPVTVVVVMRQVPATATGTLAAAAQYVATAPALVPQVAPLGAAPPAPAVTAKSTAKAVTPVTKTKKS